MGKTIEASGLLVCERCNVAKESVELMEDPYAAAINDDHSLVQICDECYCRSLDAI